MKREEFATRLGWPVKATAARLNALELLDVCTRCRGSGQYSYCQRFGTVCFKCSGSGKQLPKFSVKLVKLVQARVAAGGLVEYFAKVERMREAKKVLPSLVAECRALHSVVSNAYTAAFQDWRGVGYDKSKPMDPHLCRLQERGNRFFYNADHEYGMIGPKRMSVSAIDGDARGGKLDVLEALRLLTQRKVELAALVEDFRKLNTERRTA